MKTVTKLEFEKVYEADCGTTKCFRELHSFALTDRGREVLTAGPDYVKTRNHVGIIQTKSGMVLEILPKIHDTDDDLAETRKDFVCMLRTLRNYPKYRQMDFANLHTADLPLMEIFISMFLQEVDLIVKKGIKSDYVSREDNQFFIRGKLVAGEHIRRNSVHRERFYVRYDEYIPDIPKNRILKTAILYCKNHSFTLRNRQKIQELLLVYDGVGTTGNPEYEYKKIPDDRTADYYSRALAWAMLFLSGRSFSTYSGSSIAFSLLFPMERVFESYVYYCLSRHSRLADIRSQSSKYWLVKEGNNNLFQIRPDIVALSQDENTRCILDAKWKLLDQDSRDSKYGVSQADLYQLLSYAKIYASREEKDVRLFLMYPKTDEFIDTKKFIYNDNAGTEIMLIPFDIQATLNGDFRCLECMG